MMKIEGVVDMDILFLIVLRVIVPVFTLIGVGAFLHRKFTLDLNTLSKLTTYLLIPAVSFTNIYQSKVGITTFLDILSFLVLLSVSLMITSAILARLAKFDRGKSATFKNSVVLINSGNFGIPVSQLIFQGNPLGLSIQIFVTIFQNIITYTYGLMNSVSVNSQGKQALKEFFRIPIIYAVVLGFILNILSVEIPIFIWSPIENTANAFLGIALITLGAQSAYLKITKIPFDLAISLISRLVLSPILAFVILFVLGLDGTTAQALFIASSFPTSRNSALLALEYNNHPEYAAQTVIMSTVFSSITVTLVVYLSKVLF